MISVSLYFFSFLILFFISLFLHKRIIHKWQKVGLWIHVVLLLVSAVYHTSTYGKQWLGKAAIDQEVFYYSKSLYYSGYEDYNKGFTFLLKRLFDTVVHYRGPTNVIYLCVYWTMRDHFFGEKFFYEGFFMACILNACLHLMALFLLFKIFNKVSLKDSYKVLGFILFSQPFVIFRDAMPLANSFTVFSLILFLWTMIYNKPLVYKCLACFSLYLAHKVFYICVPFLVAYLLFFLNLQKHLGVDLL